MNYQYSPILYDQCPSSSIPGIPEWGTIIFPLVRFFDNGQNSIYQAFGMHLIEQIIIENDYELLNILQNNIKEHGAWQMLNATKNLFLESTSIAEKIKTFSRALIYVDQLARELLASYDLIVLCNALDIHLRVYHVTNLALIKSTLKGKRKFYFLEINENWWILYSKEKQAKLNSIRYTDSVLTAWQNIQKDKYSIDELLNETEKISNNKNTINGLLTNLAETYYLKKDPSDFKKLTNYFISQNIDITEANTFMNKYNCSYCKTKGELIALGCEHKLCNNCFTSFIDSIFHNYNANSRYDIPIIFQCMICQTIIDNSLVQDYYPDYQNQMSNIENHIFSTCIYCGIVGNGEVFSIRCREFCNYCFIIFMRSGFNYCCKCNYRFTEREITHLKNWKKTCDYCYQELKFYSFFGHKYCSHYFCLKCLKNKAMSYDKSCYHGCGPLDLKFAINQPIYFYHECSLCKNKIDKFSNDQIAKNCDCTICIACQANGSLEYCLGCTIRLTDYQATILNEHKQTLAKRIKRCPVCTCKFDIEEIMDYINCDHFICKYYPVAPGNEQVVLNSAA